ncbi:hypothetical protein Ancab_034690 [Ancistrocladus abbreviatus]
MLIVQTGPTSEQMNSKCSRKVSNNTIRCIVSAPGEARSVMYSRAIFAFSRLPAATCLAQARRRCIKHNPLSSDFSSVRRVYGDLKPGDNDMKGKHCIGDEVTDEDPSSGKKELIKPVTKEFHI